MPQLSTFFGVPSDSRRGGKNASHYNRSRVILEGLLDESAIRAATNCFQIFRAIVEEAGKTEDIYRLD